MDWDLAIKRNSEALKGIVEALFDMLGIVGEATVGRIPPPLHRAVLRVLRPAKSAMRRLIIIAARGLVVKVAPSRPMPKGQMMEKCGAPALPPSSSSIHGKIFRSCASTVSSTRSIPAHPFLRRRFAGGRSLASAPTRDRPPAAALRWHGQCRTPNPQAPGHQVRP